MEEISTDGPPPTPIRTTILISLRAYARMTAAIGRSKWDTIEGDSADGAVKVLVTTPVE